MRCKRCNGEDQPCHFLQLFEELISEFAFEIRRDEVIKHWQERLNIPFGLTKEEALGRVRDWREAKETCQRCEEKDYNQFCDINLICKEAEKDEEKKDGRDIKRDVDRGRLVAGNGAQTVRARLSASRERDALRQTLNKEASLFRG
jgi:hypothetical protein